MVVFAVVGWNGAAFAAFGDILVFFVVDAPPLADNEDGVKLGDSTLSHFLLPPPPLLLQCKRPVSSAKV